MEGEGREGGGEREGERERGGWERGSFHTLADRNAYKILDTCVHV